MIIEIDESKKFNSDIPVIYSNYQILHYDDEPVLYTGTNHYGNRIIGSILEDDDELQIERSLHVLVDSKKYIDFLNQRITYLEILNESRNIYLIDKKYDNTINSVYIIELSEIPIQFRPLPSSFCPQLTYIPSLSFGLSLKGLLADASKAIPREIARIQNAFADYLTLTVEMFSKVFTIKPITLLKPSTEGSFKLNFDLKLNETSPNVFLPEDKLKSFINNFIQYCINNFTMEVIGEFQFQPEKAPLLYALFQKYLEIYNFENRDEIDLKDTFLKNIVSTTSKLEDITENIGTNFSNIEIFNVSNEIENYIGYMDTHYSESLSEAIDQVESIVYTSSVDTEIKEYRMLIYHLNTDTRQGNALIQSPVDPDTFNRPKIKISGDEPLEETKYTESLYKNIWVKTKGIAHIVNNKYKRIDVTFESPTP